MELELCLFSLFFTTIFAFPLADAPNGLKHLSPDVPVVVTDYGAISKSSEEHSWKFGDKPARNVESEPNSPKAVKNMDKLPVKYVSDLENMQIGGNVEYSIADSSIENVEPKEQESVRKLEIPIALPSTPQTSLVLNTTNGSMIDQFLPEEKDGGTKTLAELDVKDIKPNGIYGISQTEVQDHLYDQQKPEFGVTEETATETKNIVTRTMNDLTTRKTETKSKDKENEIKIQSKAIVKFESKITGMEVKLAIPDLKKEKPETYKTELNTERPESEEEVFQLETKTAETDSKKPSASSLNSNDKSKITGMEIKLAISDSKNEKSEVYKTELDTERPESKETVFQLQARTAETVSKRPSASSLNSNDEPEFQSSNLSTEKKELLVSSDVIENNNENEVSGVVDNDSKQTELKMVDENIMTEESTVTTLSFDFTTPELKFEPEEKAAEEVTIIHTNSKNGNVLLTTESRSDLTDANTTEKMENTEVPAEATKSLTSASPSSYKNIVQLSEKIPTDNITESI